MSRYEERLREHGQYPQGTTIRGPELLRLADLVAAVREFEAACAARAAAVGDDEERLRLLGPKYEARKRMHAALTALDEASGEGSRG